MYNMLMVVRHCVGGSIIIIIATSAHLRRGDGALRSVDWLQHFLKLTGIHVHILSALGLVPFVAY